MTIRAVMFQRLSNLLFGEVEEVAAELKGPNPCVTEADEEGWMIVNLPGESERALCWACVEGMVILKATSKVRK